MASTGGFFPLLFRRNPNRAPIRTSKSPPSPFSVEPPNEPPKPPIVFSVTGSRGEGSLEYHQDPHLGNGELTPPSPSGFPGAAAETPCTHCLQPPSEYLEDRTSKARTTAVPPHNPVLAVLHLLPALSLLLTLCSTSTTAHRSRHKAQFSPSSTPLNVSSLLRCSTTVTGMSLYRRISHSRTPIIITLFNFSFTVSPSLILNNTVTDHSPSLKSFP
ncbi:hypothetical protein PIB30_079570 [Stylosanthes scabra]|uniref:Uncharacterized protein n=1 Tax=Stylosanthes scabra TaxID=79078 RepID=A0ABU6XSY5_9FABA|nr:hypothetical protein [Stylosanthes scabra]